MSIIISKAAQIVHRLNNPNRPYGALIVEVPTDIGRSYQGYKRGGVIEGAEKLRKEVMAAGVWLAGIPIFKALGDKLCETIFKLPIDIDYSLDDIKQGNTPVKDTIEFLTKKTKEEAQAFLEQKKQNGDFFDISDIPKRYFKNNVSIFAGKDAQKLIKNTRSAKTITSILAFALNVYALGFALPKINQALTNKKVEKLKRKNAQKNIVKFESFEEYRNKFAKKAQNQKNTNAISYKGLQSILNHPLASFTDAIENSNTFRLIAPDAPMIWGRVKTSRNIIESLENFLIDFAGVFLYNFCADSVHGYLGKKHDTPSISPILSEITASLDENSIKNAIEKLKGNENIIKIEELFDKETARTIYKTATYGKYGKINRFVKNETLNKIDGQICEFLRKLAKNNENITKENIKKFSKSTNTKNIAYLSTGLLIAILGQALLVPKFVFKLTELLTGKNEFSGLANYDDNKSKKENKQ